MDEYPHEVSCRVLGILFQELPGKDLPDKTITQGVPYPTSHLKDPRAWMDWKNFCVFMRNAGQIWDEAELVNLGQKFVRSQFAKPATTIARLFFTPKEFFQWIARQELEGRNDNFQCTRGMIHDKGPNQLEFDLTVLSGYEISTEFFLITKGIFTAMPTALGLKEASVEMVPIQNGMRYMIELPTGAGMLAGLRRFLTWPFNLRSAARDLKESNELLQLRYRELEEQIQERKRAEKLQDALFRIADIANSAPSLKELYPAIHKVVGELMPADNFFIALFDEKTDMLDLPYFVDEVDTTYAGPYKAANGLTEWVISRSEPLLVNRQEHQKMIDAGQVALVGAPAEIWLGVPLKSGANTFGAMVVQHYADQAAYQEQEKQLLSFVSGQIATVIDRKRNEEALRISERRFRQLAENIEEVFFLMSAKELKFYYVNPAYEAITGRSCESLYADPWSCMDALLPEDRQRMLKLLEDESFESRDNEFDTELRILHTDGTIKWIWIRSQPIFENNEIIGRVGVGVDVTERKALRQAQKQESLGVLAGGVAHDFNNLLVAMLGQTSLALAKMPHDSPARSHVTKAVKAAERAADLTRQMLAYSGQGHFIIQQMSLNSLIEENLHLFNAAIPKNIGVETSLYDGLPLIEADPGQLQQVIMNLILNAVEAIGEKSGLIEIKTQIQEYGPEDSTFWQYTGKPIEWGTYVRLDIRDNGGGMEENVLARIFDPFYSTKFTGRGLGLAVVLGIIRGHKGGLRVTSLSGEGTQFTILFPMVRQEPVKKEYYPPVSVEERQAGVVLVIDDEEPVRDAVRDILEIEAIQVITAASGAEGIELFRANYREIDLVLLDLSMPGLGGVQTFHRLQEIDKSVPILLSSGYNQSEVDSQFSGNMPAGFLHKPYSARGLVEEIVCRINPVEG